MMDKLKFTHIPTNTLTKKLNKTIDKVNNKFKGNYISKKMKNCLDERNHYNMSLSINFPLCANENSPPNDVKN